MKRFIAMCAAAGALAVAAPAFADSYYTNPETGQTYKVATGTNEVPQRQLAEPVYGTYRAQPSYDGGPFGFITAPLRMITAPVGMILQPASGAIGGVTGVNANLVPYNPKCFVQTGTNEVPPRHTAMCGP